MSETNQFDINKVINDAKSVLTNPAGYYQTMAKSGGFVEPLIFIAVMAVAMGVISAILSLFSSGAGGMLAWGFSAIVILLIGSLFGSFLGDQILFVVWKLMVSQVYY